MNNRQISKHAESAGMTYFMGSACRKCGNQWRYVKGCFACVECTRARCKAYQNDNRQLMNELQKNWRHQNQVHYKTWRQCHKQHGAKALIEYGV